MKKALVCFALLSIVILSCKKDNHTKTNPAGKLYPVTFNISNFTQQNVAIDQRAKTKVNAVVTPDQSNVLALLYKIYDSNNALKKTVKILKGQPNFGTVKDSLTSGNYTVVFLGITDTDQFVDDGATFHYTPPGSTDSQGFQDTYYQKISLVVGTQPLQQDVTLQRLTSKLQVIIKDAIPAGVNNITLDISNLHSYYSYLDNTSSVVLNSTYNPSVYLPVTANLIGTTNHVLGPLSPLLNTASPVTIVIKVKDINSTTLYMKTIPNIMLQRNTITTLTGNVFTNSGGSSGFNVTYNSAYDPNDINKPF
ncbi:MAG: hypothetical protein JWR38_5314 [Mucilaginibacter sp.]|nr:hypothetical protein [Mucilaginibacter sp.]